MPADSVKPCRPERTTVVLLCLATTLFVFLGIHRPMWLDEAFCALAARLPATGIVQMLRTDNSLPFYYFLLAGWVRLFGDSEVALRLLSAIFYLAGGVVAGLVGRRLGCGCLRAGVYSALFYLCSLQAIHQAQNVRMYSLLGLLSGLSLLGFLRLFFDRAAGRRWWLLYVLTNTVGVMTQHWFAFVLLAQFVALALWRRRELVRFVLLGLAAAVPFLVVWAPVLRDQVANESSRWIPPLQAWMIGDAFTRFYGGAPALFLYGFAGVVLWKADAAIRRGVVNRPSVRVAALAAAICLLVPLAVSIVRPLYWPDRYSIIALAPLAALLGVVFTETAPRPVGFGVGVLLLLFQVGLHVATRNSVTFGDTPSGRTDRMTAAYIATHGAAGDAIIFTSRNRAAGEYYLHRLGAENRFARFSFPAEMAWHMGWEQDSRWPQQAGKLEAEADALAASLRARGGHRVWVYERDAYFPSPLLRRALGAALVFEREQAAEGPYHSRLLVYRVP